MASLLLSFAPNATAMGLPAYAPRRPAADPVVVRCSLSGAVDGGGARSADDYQATLRTLNSKGVRRAPRKSLGQNYMLNSSVNEQLSSIAEIKEGDIVLEIGPGTGSLTNVLVDAGATVLAVEKDPRMAALVRDRFQGVDRLTVLEEDFMKCHFHSYMSHLLESKKSMGTDLQYAKVVSNIPFNISTDIIKRLLPLGDIFSDVVLLLQDETALRLVDPSLRTSEYRPINIFVNFYSGKMFAEYAEYQFKVERKNFFPQPNVDAAVVTFKLKRTADYPEVGTIKGFFSMVNSAFNAKRKMLRKSLQHFCTSLEIEEALKNAGLPVTSRPEELSLDDFVRLHNLLTLR
ncbi:hypothetical protein Taro_012120 [Colocasia esculenta]|uniref:rRNA adenine N(6)-methyltransferase n=1 Tax=Colocasia esculenta TaxID=4460 RepID=A0A843U861_COLES|nr:hypothetical protein [Colocasia esculenta]